MDNRPVNTSPQNTHRGMNTTLGTDSASQKEMLQLSGKHYKVSKAVIWGLKLCRTLFSLGGTIKRPENYFNRLIDEKQNGPQQKPITERNVTHTQISSGFDYNRPLPDRPLPDRPLPPTPGPQITANPSLVQRLPVRDTIDDSNQYQYGDDEFPESMDVFDPSLSKATANQELSPEGKDIQHSVLSAFSLLENLPPELNRVHPEEAEDEKSINGFKSLKKQSNKIAIPPEKSLNSPDNKTEEADRFRSIADPKYRNIHCHKEFCASTTYQYHATKIDMPNGKYIAAQGPISTTEENFLHLLKENNSPISVALIGEGDLRYTRGPRIGTEKNMLKIGPIDIGRPQTIPPQKDENGNVIAEAFEIELVETIDIPSLNFRIDKLKFDGETHFRVSEMGWKDFSAGNPARLVAVALIVEKLRQNPEVVDRIDERIVVNCNAGVGRTGSFITTDNTVRQYLEQDGHFESDFDQKILDARARRNNFVQTDGQYSTLNTVHQNLAAIAEPIIDALEMRKLPESQEAFAETQLPVDVNDDNTSVISGSSSISEESTDSEYASVSGTQFSRLFDEFNGSEIINDKFKNEAELVSKLEGLSIANIRRLIVSGDKNSVARNISDNNIKNKAITLVASIYGKKKAVKYISDSDNDFQKAKEKVENEYKTKNNETHTRVKNAALQEINRQSAINQPPAIPEQKSFEPETPYENYQGYRRRESSDVDLDTVSVASSSSEEDELSLESSRLLPKPKPRGITSEQLATLSEKVTAETIMRKINSGAYQDWEQLYKDLGRVKSKVDLNKLTIEFSALKNQATEERVAQAWEQAINYISVLRERMDIAGPENLVDQPWRTPGSQKF